MATPKGSYIRVKGAKVTADTLRKLGPATRQKLAEHLSKVGTKVKRRAQQLAPVDTGELRRNLRKRTNSRRLSVRIQGEARYSSFVEFGTEKMDAEPYLGPAVEEFRDELVDGVELVTMSTARNLARATVGALFD